MTPLRVLIVDDEPLARRGIRQLLTGDAGVEVAGEARNGFEAVRLVKALDPDLVFLDVQMPELDGFGVLRQLADPLPLIIFVTAYDTFAVRAFDAHAVDYLVKPLHEARFLAALARARERLRSKEAIALSRRLARLLVEDAVDAPPRPDAPKRLVLGTSGADLVLDVDDIDWIEAEDYYAAVHTRGRRHLVRESLASLETRLDRQRFVRVHRSAIVNLSRVVEIRMPPGRDAVLILRAGTALPVSRRRREQVADALRRFAG